MKVVYVAPGKPAEVLDIGGKLKDLQEVVEGYIETVYPFDDNTCIICNEEGKLLGLPPNRLLRDEKGIVYDVVCGPFVVAGLGEENFDSLTPEQINFYLEKFGEPQFL